MVLDHMVQGHTSRQKSRKKKKKKTPCDYITLVKKGMHTMKGILADVE